MTITVVTTSFNETYILPFFVKHYKTISNNIVVYDNESTDGTSELAKSLGCTVIPRISNGRFDDSLHVTLFNYVKEDYLDSDFIILVDTDEFLYSKTLLKDLQEAKERGFTAFKNTLGYEMFSETTPDLNNQIYESIKKGIPEPTYNKYVIFNPSKIKKTQYAHGRCFWIPEGEVKYSDKILYLLHYKYIGNINRIIKKHYEYRCRIDSKDKFSLQEPLYTEKLTREIAIRLKNTSEILDI